MALRWYTAVIDSHDPQAQARWWAEALDWQIVFDSEEESVILPKHASTDEIEDLDDWLRQGQGLLFVRVPESKTIKNRVHLDFAPHTSQDRDAEIQRLLDFGAQHVDVGQRGDETFTVLADPEGNEFCVLSSRIR